MAVMQRVLCRFPASVIWQENLGDYGLQPLIVYLRRLGCIFVRDRGAGTIITLSTTSLMADASPG
jgi:hypothetical protein